MKNIAQAFFALALICSLPGFIATAAAQEPILVERNLFSPDRTPPSLEESAAESGEDGLALSPESIQLDAVLIFGEMEKALLSYPSADSPQIQRNLPPNIKGAAPRQRRSSRHSARVQRENQWVVEKDQVANFTVKSIKSDEVQLERDGQDFVIYLHQQDKISEPDTALPTAPSEGGAPAAAQKPPTVPGQKAPATPTKVPPQRTPPNKRDNDDFKD